MASIMHRVITELSMDEQHEEIDGVEICNWCVKTSGKRPRQSHQPITAESDVNKTPKQREIPKNRWIENRYDINIPNIHTGYL